MDYLGKEVLTNTDLWTIFERNGPFVYIEKVLDIWVQLMKNGGKNKCCVYNFVQCMYVYMLMHYKSSCTVPQPAAWLTMFLFAHVQYLCEAFV